VTYVRTSGSPHCFTHMPAATLNQAAPVQNTWYTVLDTTKDGYIHSIGFSVATTDEDLEVKLTVDGQTYTATQTAVAGTKYNIFMICTATSIYCGALTTDSPIGLYTELSFRSVKVEIRKTTANGTGNLQCAIFYAKY